jgi:hypothetical protein
MERFFAILIALLITASRLFSQTATPCGGSNSYVADSNYPSVYLAFERFGRWEPNPGQDGEPTIVKGDEVWLRLRNNSCGSIRFEGFSNSHGTTLVGKSYYVAAESDGKYIPQSYGDTRLGLSLPAGSAFLFPVKKEHLTNLRSIFVEFEYGWEKANVRNPIHRAFFRRSVEELKSK